MLFQDKEKSNYMIVYVRLFIAVKLLLLKTQAYIKENKILYESFLEGDIDSWCLREVEAVDNECDQVQIMAVVNAFQIGVVIEYLNPSQIDTMMFPEDAKEVFINMLFRPGHYDILYPI